jgi:hypothetical protein
MNRDPKDPYSLDHAFVGLIKGMEENYAWMGEHWPDSRYVVISLPFDMQSEEVKTPWIEGWHCVYDLKTGHFRCLPTSPKTTRRLSNILNPNEIDRQRLSIRRHPRTAP